MKLAVIGGLLAMILSVPLGFVQSQDMMRSPWKVKAHQLAQNDSVQSSWFFHIYSKYISPIDGDRCPMYPSCSRYAKQVFTRYGSLVGFIMTTDRLTRCGNDLRKYQHIIDSGREYFIDIP